MQWEDLNGQPDKILHVANIREVVMARLGFNQTSIQHTPNAFKERVTKISAKNLRDWGLEQVITKNPFFNSHFDALIESFADLLPLSREEFENVKRFSWKTSEQAAQNVRRVVMKN